MFGRSLGDVVSDNNKVPVLTQAGNDDYYLVVNTQTKTTKKISASTNYDEVATFADLPSSGMTTNDIIVVRTTTGVIGFRKIKGFYRYTGSAWERLSESWHADKVYYDNSGSSLSSTDVNAAINELQTEKQAALTQGTRITISNNTISTAASKIAIQSSDPNSSSNFSDAELILNNTNGRLFWLKSDNTAIYYSNNDAAIDLTFSINSFSDNISSTTLLVGSGTWKAVGALTFNISYNNGPPTSAIVEEISANPDLQVASNTGTSFTNTVAVPYPVRGATIQFRYTADTLTVLESLVAFQNHIKWGRSSVASSWTSSHVVALSGTSLSTDQTITETLTGSTSGTYVLFAFPSSYTSIHNLGFYYNGLTAGFESVSIVSVTNSESYTENYKLYRSTLASMANGTLQTSTSALAYKNKIYYGVSTTTGESGDLFNESIIKSLSSSFIQTGSSGQSTSKSITGNGVNKYVIFAFPTRLTSLNANGIKYNNITAAFNSYDNISVQNDSGFTENYIVYRSALSNMGNHTLSTSTSSTLINKLYYGPTTDTELTTESEIEGLSNNVVSNDHTRNWAYTNVSNKFLYISIPSRLSDFHSEGYKYNNELIAFTKKSGTVAVVNTSGKSETYETYKSNIQITGNHTLTTSTSSLKTGALRIYYGRCNKNTSFNSNDIIGLASAGGGSTSELSSDATQTWDEITMDSSRQYFVLAVPNYISGSGSLSFVDTGTGFAVGMHNSSPNTVSVTNQWGFTSDYYVYATNQQLGNGNSITVRSS